PERPTVRAARCTWDPIAGRSGGRERWPTHDRSVWWSVFDKTTYQTVYVVLTYSPHRPHTTLPTSRSHERISNPPQLPSLARLAARDRRATAPFAPAPTALDHRGDVPATACAGHQGAPMATHRNDAPSPGW